MATLWVGGAAVPLSAALVLSDTSARIEATSHSTIGTLLSDLDPKLLVLAKLTSTAETPWIARHVTIGGTSLSWAFDTGSAPAQLKLQSPWITVTLREGKIAFTREVFSGVKIGAYTDRIARREPPLPMNPSLLPGADSIRTTLQGRPTIVYELPTHDETREVMAILYHGSPFKEPQRRALTSLFGYLCGGRASHVVTETFDVKDKLSIEYTKRGESTTRLSPPVPLNRPTAHVTLVVKEIPALFDRFVSIYGDRTPHGRIVARRLDAVLHHYAEGVDSAYSTTKILRLAVAFEALVNLVTADTATNENIMTTTRFRHVEQTLVEALKTLLSSGHVNVTECDRLTRKVHQLNSASNMVRMAKFWNLTRTKRTSADDELIRKLRNESVHQGFVGAEDTRRAMLKIYHQANRLTDLFNRAFLTYLDYRGPVLSANEKRWMNARTGRKFKLPTRPAAPSLQLQITTTVGPLSEAEQVVVQKLRALPGRGKPTTRRRAPK